MSTIQERIDSSSNSVQAGKESISNAIISKGVTPTGSTFSELANGINSISTIEEAPNDGNTYGRKNGAWSGIPKEVEVNGSTPSGNPDIWIDTSVSDTSYAIPEAPNDGKMYGRRSKQWSELNARNMIFSLVHNATSLSNLPIDKYSIAVSISAASTLSFASTPYTGFECMIDIKNTGSAAITQPLPTDVNWQCNVGSIVIAAGMIGSISVRYIHNTYLVNAKGS